MHLFYYLKEKIELYVLTCVFLFTFTMTYGQNISLETNLDTTTNQIATTIYFTNIPVATSARWQQILHPSSNLLAIDTTGILWDTTNHLLTVIWEEFPKEDTVVLFFNAEFTPTFPETFSWGEGAFLFKNTDEKIDKMKVSFQKIQYKSRYQESSITFSEYIYYIQVGALSEDKQSNYKLYDEDKIFKIKASNCYKYQVGPYNCEAEAKERLLFYKKQVPDAFIVKEKRELE